jgi:transcriptional regulator with XRE-family HTH domain
MGEESKPEWIATGKRLRQIEIAEGLSGNKIAAELGINARAWSNYKMGRRELPIPIAGELRRLYGVGLEWLYLNEFHRNSEDFKQRLAAAQHRTGRGPG